MKVLFLSYATYGCYQADSLFIGIRRILGENAVDFPKIHSLYEQTSAASNQDWGKGFTLGGRLADISVDRSDIEAKIKNRFFDLIIYGNIHRASPFLDLVLDVYPKEKIVFIDGADDKYVITNLLFRGHYFKREITVPVYGVHPIGFSIPEEHICATVPDKKRLFSICDPRDRKTYIYKTEQEYYAGYRESYFGVTMQKAGWDSMRHYEIIANGCLPYFLKLNECPVMALTHLPKIELLQCNELALMATKLKCPPAVDIYHDMVQRLLRYARRNLTCVAVAKQMFERIDVEY